jgi:glycosyltransferase involved in cell wall biosynthesis
MKKSLYICYFGVREPLVQTQVIPYLKEILKAGIEISLLTFEPDLKSKWSAAEIEIKKKEMAEDGITWYCLPYHKRPSAPATLYDILCGAWLVRKIIKQEKIDILHARIHVPGVMAGLARKFSFSQKPKLLFDIRGFFPEEYVDAGNWKADGWLYKSAKRVEKWIFKESAGFVVLTEKAREILFPESKETGFDKFGRPVEVIPCCVDLSRFQEISEETKKLTRREMNLENRFVITYVGSFGGWYMTEEMMSFFKTAKERNRSTFALILTQSDPEPIRAFLEKNGFGNNDLLIKRVPPAEIPKILSTADLALSFIKPCYSKLSSSPTKIAEYLACGAPIITNGGIGDVDEVIQTDQVGIVIEDFAPESYLTALQEMEKLFQEGNLPAKCQTSAEKRFDLSLEGGTKYRRLYKRLLSKN